MKMHTKIQNMKKLPTAKVLLAVLIMAASSLALHAQDAQDPQPIEQNPNPLVPDDSASVAPPSSSVIIAGGTQPQQGVAPQSGQAVVQPGIVSSGSQQIIYVNPSSVVPQTGTVSSPAPPPTAGPEVVTEATSPTVIGSHQQPVFRRSQPVRRVMPIVRPGRPVLVSQAKGTK